MGPSNTATFCVVAFMGLAVIHSEARTLTPKEANFQNVSSASDILQQMSANDRATLAAISISEQLGLMQNMSMEDSFKFLSTGKKAYQQEVGPGTGEIRDIRDFLSIDIVPFLVNKVFTPLLRRVLNDTSLYPLGNGASTVSPPASTVPPKQVVELEIQVEDTTSTTTVSPRPANPSTTENGNSARDLLRGDIEPSPQATTPASKMRYNIRFRERPSPTEPSTRKPYVEDEDDEDESVVFNKIKHL